MAKKPRAATRRVTTKRAASKKTAARSARKAARTAARPTSARGGKAAATGAASKKATRRPTRKAARSTSTTPAKANRRKATRAASTKRSGVAAARAAKRRKIETISSDIVRGRRLGKGVLWVVEAEVHVRAGVTLTIADGATILIRNGLVSGSRLRRAALVFDPGAGLSARRFTVKAGDDRHRAVKVADNGGLWFLGTHRGGSSDGITVKPTRGAKPSSYRADLITVSHLGRGERDFKVRGSGKAAERDDLDALKLIGVGPQEWKIKEIRSLHSADDGFDLTNSHIVLDRLEVKNPTEDGLNVTSSRVQIRRSLVVEAPRTKVADRDLFDLETDEGASYVELPRGCWVRLRGVFGDQLRLSSTDMPRPVTTADNERRYAFSGRLKADALIHSITED